MTTTPSPSRRVPRRRRAAPGAPATRPSSRTAILAATEALLLAEGVTGMSIRKVTDRCGYTAPTIYHHFGDKAGLVSAVVEGRFRRILELMSSIPRGPDAAHYLREMARAFVGFALENPDHYRLLSVPGVDPAAVPSAEAARSLVKRALEELAREGTLATADIQAAYETTWAMLHGLISLRLLRPEYPFSDQLLETALDVVEAGLLRRSLAARTEGQT
jgi:AcrR family transcriptional regulator